MLGVVATLCVVSLAARQGQLWFHDTPVATPVARAKDMRSAAMPALALTGGPAAPADTAPAAIRRYLRARFDEVDYRDGSSFTTGLAYYGAPLVEVGNERLQRALPGTRFFTTKLANADFEDRWVDALISYRRGSESDDVRSEHDDIRSLLSPRSWQPSHKFFGQFLGLSAPTPADRQEIALGLAHLLAAITYEGVARPLPDRGMFARAELRHGERRFREIEILPRAGRVDYIAVKNPYRPRDSFSAWDFHAFIDF
jgi:hypothetical protein